MIEHFDYKVKQLISKKIDEKKDDLLSRQVSSYDQYQYELGKLHALEGLMLDYQDLLKEVVKDE
ncbi:MAG TPA: hypothetical protein DF712_06200 [Balneola sp.]|jgi:hypothetical protein|uniref:hypothetical protein n=1 Tax=Hyphomonas sp. TaxID=87 RepID=UPI000C8D8ACE|nr:hypothetical protein [Hyphomonas sp.]MAL44240.1 hypothetical protein [Hyphomonas sp.]HCT52035.1 hypothetical protein [Balneola sp.]|tara:strand:- start:380 stop:571 length:192 start_codon:yes stop_codon:yes gene_type:complete